MTKITHYTNGTKITHPTSTTPSKRLVFVANKKDGLVRYHKATCGRVTQSAENPTPQYEEPTAGLLTGATRATCCKPAVGLLAPYNARVGMPLTAATLAAMTAEGLSACLGVPVTVTTVEADGTASAVAEATPFRDPGLEDQAYGSGTVVTKAPRKAKTVAQVDAAVVDAAVEAVATALAPKVPKTFLVVGHPEGYTCRTCGTAKPVSAYPTTTGPEVRGTRCRACRDAAKSAA